MGEDKISTAAPLEVLKRYAQAYENASKKEKGQILDMMVQVTGWNRDHAPPAVALPAPAGTWTG